VWDEVLHRGQDRSSGWVDAEPDSGIPGDPHRRGGAERRQRCCGGLNARGSDGSDSSLDGSPAVAVVKPAGLDEVRARLVVVGFKKRAGQVFTRELGDDVLGWLGLNRATRHRPVGEVEVNPVVGVRHQGVERVVAELRGEKFHAYQPPTVNTSLGYLMPEQRYRGWVIDADGSAGAPEDLARAVEAYALPLMEASVSLSRLCELLDDGMGFDHQLVYRRPVAWLLAGDESRGLALIDEAEAGLGGRDDAAAVELRAFAAAFRERLGVSPSG